MNKQVYEEQKKEQEGKRQERNAYKNFAQKNNLDEALVLKYAADMPTLKRVAKDCIIYGKRMEELAELKSKILRNDRGTVSFINKNIDKTNPNYKKINKITIIECAGAYFDADMSLFDALKQFMEEDGSNYNHEYSAYEVDNIEDVIKRGKRWVNEKYYCPETIRNFKSFMDCNKNYETKAYKDWIKTGTCDNFDGMILDIVNKMKNYDNVKYDFERYYADKTEQNKTTAPTGADRGFCFDKFVFKRFGVLLLKRSDLTWSELSGPPVYHLSWLSERKFEYLYEEI